MDFGRISRLCLDDFELLIKVFVPELPGTPIQLLSPCWPLRTWQESHWHLSPCRSSPAPGGMVNRDLQSPVSTLWLHASHLHGIFDTLPPQGLRSTYG
jgi:hypothetical protein